MAQRDKSLSQYARGEENKQEGYVGAIISTMNFQ